MALGGVAYYWSLLEKGKSPDQNINALFFGRDDGLKWEFEELYTSLFANAEPYVNVILALGKTRAGLSRDEIAKKLGVASSGNLSEWLGNLAESGFIRLYTPVGCKTGGIYQLIDNFSLFHLRFNRVEAFQRIVGEKRILHVTLVTASGLAHNVYWNDVQSEVTLDDLLKE